MDLYYRNVRFHSQRRVWQWCSSLLRPNWEQVVYPPLSALMGISGTAEGDEDTHVEMELFISGTDVFAKEALNNEKIARPMGSEPPDPLSGIYGGRGIIPEGTCV
jgi:hypothetical protein